MPLMQARFLLLYIDCKTDTFISLYLLVLRTLLPWSRFQATGAWKLKCIPFHISSQRHSFDDNLLKRKGNSPSLSLSWNRFHMHTQSERKQILHELVYGRRSRHFHRKDVILFLLRLLVKFPSVSVTVKVDCEQNPEWLPKLPNKFYSVVVVVFRYLGFRQIIEIWKVEKLEEKQRELFCLDLRNAVTTCPLNNKLTLWVEMKMFSFLNFTLQQPLFLLLSSHEMEIFHWNWNVLVQKCCGPILHVKQANFFTELTNFLCSPFQICNHMSGTSSKNRHSCSCSVAYKEQM